MAEEQRVEGGNGRENAFAAPSISLPKGGGAIRGIGEKFAANPVTGTGSMTVPLAVSPGRSGFGPQLSLSYDSGSGNGPFGFGWSLSIPDITRKTDKGLPQYRDAEESDVYILSGAEDLVPIPKPAGAKDPLGYKVQRYRPRIEGLFARIERWTTETGEIHWRSISRDNVTTLYGRDNQSRIFDPADPDPEHPTRIFSWLICQSYDDKGNAIVYEYAAENESNVDRAQASERNRERTANRHLKRIKYGNRVSRLIEADLTQAEWMFELVFDYGEGHYEEVTLDPAKPESEQHRFVRASASPGRLWAVRPDPFSSHRPGFEVRTYRRCQRVLMLHRFAELGPEPYLVRATEFDYDDLPYAERPDSKSPRIDDELVHPGSTRFASFIRAIIQSGFVCRDTGQVLERDGVRYLTYLKKSMPPLEFEYSRANIRDEIQELDAHGVENLPVGLDGATYQWVDLDAEGVSGILTEQSAAWFYKPNLGEGRFGPQVPVGATPSTADLSGGRQQLLDLAGEGQLDLVTLAGPAPGFYERTQDEDWESFKPLAQLPNISWDAPNLRFVDLNGDGHVDVLITEHETFTWHPSLAEEGFGPARHVAQSHEEEQGPRLVFADGTQSIYLADMCGDGLADLVRIRNGEVCYWPNLGYGRFGAKVAMDDAPWFDHPEQFSQQRIRLADIDGSGVTDIIYLGHDGARVYFNQSGNRWSGPRLLSQFPGAENLSSVTTVDLLGRGTACLVWSSPLPGAARRPVRYIDLMGGEKPHLLVGSTNNLGAETRIRYAPSTRFYLADKLAGKPWITRLPFPVHVVERVETYDRVSGNHFVTRYEYHHGYFDGVEREFRGFGRVDQFDTEELPALMRGEAHPVGTNVEPSSHVPPVLTRTWFHNGAYLGRDHVSDFFAGLRDDEDVGEYYREPGLTEAQARERLLEDTVLPARLTVEEEREACRALKGSMLRQEIYAVDGTDQAEHPYTVTEHNFTIRRLQPKNGSLHPVFFTHARESVNYYYERNPRDPRIAHALTLEVDEFGNVLKSAAVGYGRRQPDPDLEQWDQDRQGELLITYTENGYTNPVSEDDAYHIPLASESRTYELTGYAPTGAAGRFQASDFVQESDHGLTQVVDTEINYEDKHGGGKQRRLIEQVRTYYRPNDLGGAVNDPADLLPQGRLESLALPGESYRLAFTPGLVTSVYRRNRSDGAPEDLLPDPAAVLEGPGGDRGGYADLDGDGHWWVPSGRVFYSDDPASTPGQELDFAREHFFLPHRYRDPFHTAVSNTESFVTYDRYALVLRETSDALGNVVSVETQDDDDDARTRIDYRVMQPYWVTDPNGNRKRVAFDALGLVTGTAIMGKPGENLGDSLDSFEADLTQAQTDGFYEAVDPHGPGIGLLKAATTRIVYDLHNFWRTRLASPNDPHKWLPAYAATLDRETHASDPPPVDGLKVQVNFCYSDGFGREIQRKIEAEPGRLVEGGPTMSPRWVGSGWTIFNNKGKPVRQYEPFFSASHRYEFGVQFGVSPILFYDPLERAIATVHPNHSWEKVIFDAWQQVTWDVNDTVTLDPRDDRHVKGFFLEPDGKPRLPTHQYLPTWHALRTHAAHAGEADQRWPDPNVRRAEKEAAEKAAGHAKTPTVAHFDSLGRTFLTLVHNGFEPDGTPSGKPLQYPTRFQLDIEGNQREVRDAVEQDGDQGGRIVMRYDYDMLGNRIHHASMEAGERWTLDDVGAKTIRTWDSRGHQFRTEYDRLRRPFHHFVRGADATRSDRRTLDRDVLFERVEYGEGHVDDQGQLDDVALNLRTHVFRQYDGAGVVTNMGRNSVTGRNESYDFKGNLLHHARELARDYRSIADWSIAVQIDAPLSASRTYDALNRPVTLTAPDNSVYRHIFNKASLLDKVEVNLRGEQENGQTKWTTFVVKIDYNAKGQRTRIEYGGGKAADHGGVATAYGYDPHTFRLTHLETTRPAGLNGLASEIFVDPTVVQDLRYTYDSVGNLTRIEDAALKTVIHDGQQVEPAGSFTYDALYRLIEAQGREHIGQTAFAFEAADGNYRDYPLVGHAHPNDLRALRNYTEHYEYDQVGNFRTLRHRIAGGGWTRTYNYSETSLLEDGSAGTRLKTSNRLSSTTVGNGLNHVEPYTYDVHGSMTVMPHLKDMAWNFEDRLQRVDLGGGGTAYYVYDAAGERARKVIEVQGGRRQKERIYLGNYEVYQEFNGDGTAVMHERQTLHVMDDRQRIALVDTQTIQDGNPANGAVALQRYQLGNHLGSATMELTEAGTLVSYEEYHPYSTTAFQAGRSAAEVKLKRYRYTSKERDEETGFYQYGARYYLPSLGMWVTCDDSFDDGLSLYTFAKNNPIKFMDVDGRRSATPEETAVLNALQQRESASRARFNEQSTGRKIWSYIVGGPQIEAGRAKHNREGYAAAIERAAKGEAVLIGPGFVEGTFTFHTQREANFLRQLEIGQAIASSALAGATYTIADLAGAQAETKENLTLAASSLSDVFMVAAPPVAAHFKAKIVNGTNTKSGGAQPPQFAVGNAGEEMAKFSVRNSAVPGPEHLLEGKYSLKDATGKTVYPGQGRMGARFPDVPIAAERGSVGTVEHKTPLSGPEDPKAYLQRSITARKQISNESSIMKKGATFWGPKEKLTPVVQGEGVGLSTGYWYWFPPLMRQ